MNKAYSLFLALSNKPYEVYASDITKNSDCGRLNLMCECCYERVYWVFRKNQKFFSHFPNSKNALNCEKFSNKKTAEQRKKGFLSAINREKAQYEKHFWQIITQVYPAWERYERDMKVLAKTSEPNQAFEQFYYPELKEREQSLIDLLNKVYDSNIEIMGDFKKAKKSEKIYNAIIKKATKQYREVIVRLLFAFLMQKRSIPIVKQFYFLSLILVFEQSNNTLPSTDYVNNFAINVMLNMLVWVPWEECLNDIQCYGKILPKHCYEKDFICFLITSVEAQNKEESQCLLTIN